MKKYSLQVVIVIVLMLVITSSAFAKIKTVYQTNQPIPIMTKLGTQTVLFFESEIEFAVSNANYFQVNSDKKNNKLSITPKKAGAKTNLIVTTKKNNKYVFHLVENKKQDYYDLVNVKAAPKINYKEIINLVNKRKIAIDPAVRELVNIYEIDKNRFKFSKPSLKLIVKRAVTIKSLNKTVLWFRLVNNSKGIIRIPLNSIDIEKRERFALAGEINKEKLEPGEMRDYYILLEGTYLDNSYTVLMNVNGQDKEYKIKNIPYNKQEFKVFIEDANNYINLRLENYQR